jgi:hypothetical protein
MLWHTIQPVSQEGLPTRPLLSLSLSLFSFSRESKARPKRNREQSTS